MFFSAMNISQSTRFQNFAFRISQNTPFYWKHSSNHRSGFFSLWSAQGQRLRGRATRKFFLITCIAVIVEKLLRHCRQKKYLDKARK